MNDGSWRRYISLFTATPINIDASALLASLEKAFRANNFTEPFNTQTNAPDNTKNAPIVKIETQDGKNGVWIGNQLIFMPVGSDEEVHRLFNALQATELASLKVRSYSLNASRFNSVNKEQIQEMSPSDEITNLLSNNVQELSRNATKQLSDTLTAKDDITFSRSETGGLLIEMAIAIDSTDMTDGQTVGDIFASIDLKTLTAHEDDVKKQANSILIGK